VLSLRRVIEYVVDQTRIEQQWLAGNPYLAVGDDQQELNVRRRDAGPRRQPPLFLLGCPAQDVGIEAVMSDKA
jgi:hypothetical protein